MEIQIISEQANTVWVSTAFGCFYGIWCSATPIVTKRYIVELDSDDVLTADEVELSQAPTPSIQNVGQRINITGLVEEIQDEVMILRLGNTIVMLELASCTDFVKYIGQYVCVKLSEVKLYDTGIY